jgi:O-antigen/teichoic acid export membrane protein
MIRKIRVLADKGFFHILGADVMNKVIGFASSIVLVRILSKEEFGLFSYAQNILMIFLLFNGLGTLAGMLQFGSESFEEQRKNSFFSFGLRIGISFNFIISISVLTYCMFFSFNIESVRPILGSMFLLPVLMFIFEAIQVLLRSSMENKKFAFLCSLNTFMVFVSSIIGAYLFQVYGVVFSRYFTLSISIIVGFMLCKERIVKFFAPFTIDKKSKMDFVKFSAISSFNNGVSSLLYLLDVFLIGIILVDPNTIASYKTATLIPFALNSIPLSVMVFLYPYFAKNNQNKEWIKDKYLILTKYLFAFNLLVAILLMTFAPVIISLVFGAQYLDSLAQFRILLFGYFIVGTFRIPVGNILVMMKKIKFGMYMAIFSGVVNILLNIYLIRQYGSLGAAIATIIILFFTSIAGVYYLMRILNSRPADVEQENSR